MASSYFLGGSYEYSNEHNDVILLNMGYLGRGTIVRKENHNYMSVHEEIDSRHILRGGEFLFNTRNTLDLVGKVALYNNEYEYAIFDNNILMISWNPSMIISSAFMVFLFNTDQYLASLRRLATGTTSVAAIYTRDLLQLHLSLPPLPEQEKIAEVLAAADRRIALAEEKLAALHTQKKGLMQQLLTGKVRVKRGEGV